MKVQKLTTMAVMIAVSIVLVTLVHFPLIPAAAFLEYDPADIPILLVTLMYGPLAGVGVTAAACIVQGVTVSAASGPYGIIMHFIATGTYVLAAGIISSKFAKSWKGTAVALILGCIVMTAVMVPANLFITPLFLGQTIEDILPMLMTAIIPFNLLKAGINGAVTFVLSRALRKYMQAHKLGIYSL